IEDAHRSGADVREMAFAHARDAGSMLSLHRTPGHVLEACWFIHHAADALDLWGRSPLFSRDTLADVAAHACQIGWDAQEGGLFRYTHHAGGPPEGMRTDDRYEQMVVDTWDTKLWWVHAEALYTTLMLGIKAGRPDLLAWHDRLHRYTLRTFPAGAGQEWIQTRRRDGTPLEATVALPVKDPFHVARALLLLTELLNKELITS
ncbi:MAG: AGE family epimerase/isomerase, partial [Rhodocyclaceae bacterium]